MDEPHSTAENETATLLIVKISIRFLLLYAVLHLLCVPVAHANDAYHGWLTTHLATEFDLSDGDVIFYDNEQTLWDEANISTAHYDVRDVENMPFGRAFHAEIKTLPDSPWSDGVWLDLPASVNTGDAVLLTFWTRSSAADIDGGMINIVLEEKGTWHKFLEAYVLPTDEWQQHYFATTINRSENNPPVHLSFQLGAQRQTIEIGGIAAVNFGSQYTVDDLPHDQFDDYVGRDQNAVWRDEARARIEEHRKSDLTINVRSFSGDPIPDAQIHVELQNPQFEWGTSVSTHKINGTSEDDRIYREKLLDMDGNGRGFNVAVPENALKWRNWEQDSSTYWAQDETADAIQWLDQNGLHIHGHTVLWGNWSEMPTDLQVNNAYAAYAKQSRIAYASERMSDRVADVLTDPRLAAVDSWEILNEPRDPNVLPMMFRDDPYAEYASWFNTAVQTDPSKPYSINDFSSLAFGGMQLSSKAKYREIIDGVLANGGHIDSIGLQGHMYPSLPLTPPERIIAILDEFDQAYNRPIHITEFDLKSANYTLEGQYMRDFLIAIYSHPAVEGFTMWGFYDGAHWRGYSPIFFEDWGIKPSGWHFRNLVFDQWWTDERGATDEQGVYQTRGFLGDYLITVTADGQTQHETLSLNPDGKTVDVVFITDADHDLFTNRLFIPYLQTR